MNGWNKLAWALFLLGLTCAQFLSTQGAGTLDKSAKRSPWWRKPKRPVCSSSRPGGRHYVNEWDGFLAYQCRRGGQSITSIYSVYRSCKRDRIWSFTCGYNKAARQNCHWSSHYDNDFDKPLNFKCPNQGFITGVQSEHNNHFEDRRFKFRCCNSRNYVHYKCSHSHDVNDWQELLDYKVNRQKRFYLVGATSYHENSKEDRRWKFEVCHLRYRPGHKREIKN